MYEVWSSLWGDDDLRRAEYWFFGLCVSVGVAALVRGSAFLVFVWCFDFFLYVGFYILVSS